MSPAQALRQRCHGLSVGIFAAPLGTLADAVGALAGWGGRMVHFDVMDGVFVPEITAGPGFVAALGTNLVRDVHLMVARPSEQVAAFARAGADIITVHAEAPDAKAALVAVRRASAELGRPILAGLAILPTTPLRDLSSLLVPVPDLILVLALDPRDGKPANLGEAAARARIVRGMAASAHPLIALDGGVTEKSVAEIAVAAPDIIVTGSAVFRAPDPETAFRRLARSVAAPAPQAENAT